MNVREKDTRMSLRGILNEGVLKAVVVESYAYNIDYIVWLVKHVGGK